MTRLCFGTDKNGPGAQKLKFCSALLFTSYAFYKMSLFLTFIYPYFNRADLLYFYLYLTFLNINLT